MDLYWIWRFFFWAERTGGKKRELVLVGRRWSWIESGRSRQWPVEAGAHGGGAVRAKQVDSKVEGADWTLEFELASAFSGASAVSGRL